MHVAQVVLRAQPGVHKVLAVVVGLAAHGAGGEAAAAGHPCGPAPTLPAPGVCRGGPRCCMAAGAAAGAPCQMRYVRPSDPNPKHSNCMAYRRRALPNAVCEAIRP